MAKRVAALYDIHGNLAALADVPADALAVRGHTRTQFERTIGRVRVVNAGSVGMAYEDEPGAYWLLPGPGIERRRSGYELDAGDYQVAWPSATREEAVAWLESRAIGS